jgi:hypothetical protein
VDWIKFQVTGLSAITLETSGATSADTRMWLYNSSLTQVEFNDDGGAGYYSKIDRLCSVDALPSGTYYVKVDEYGNNNPISSYTLSLIVDPCFRKTSPENGAINESLSPTLSWLSTVVPDSYEYCLEDTASNITNLCDTSWVSTGTATSKSLSGLSVGTTYYWQVRATDIAGTTYANGSETAYGSFTTGYAPAVFNKFGPVNAATEVVLFPVLKWASSKGVTPASSYEYCYDTTNDNACSNWIDNRLSTNTSLSNLSPLTTYYWNVRAKNEFGITNSYNNEWWTFTTKSTSLHISYSAAANDGWTLESSRFSSVASTKSAAGTLRVGNDARTRQYRSILHFDTASLPENAIITNVTLQIKKASDGTPTPGDFVADIKKGFFGLASLELGDFNAAAEPINNAGRFVVTSDPNGYWLTLSSVNFKYINLFGATQFRLRFTKDDKAGYISFYAGDAALSNQPQLSVEYWVP